MAINHCRRLRAAVTIRVIEIESGDGMLTEGTFEGDTAVHRFGCVISHISILAL